MSLVWCLLPQLRRLPHAQATDGNQNWQTLYYQGQTLSFLTRDCKGFTTPLQMLL